MLVNITLWTWEHDHFLQIYKMIYRKLSGKLQKYTLQLKDKRLAGMEQQQLFRLRSHLSDPYSGQDRRHFERDLKQQQIKGRPCGPRNFQWHNQLWHDFSTIVARRTAVKSRKRNCGAPVAQNKFQEILLGNRRPVILFAQFYCDSSSDNRGKIAP